MGRAATALVLLASLGVPSLALAQTPGWTDIDLGAGHRARRYLPNSVRPCDPLPVLLFLHGAGGTPEAYESHLTPDAEALGLVLVLPLSTSAGWGDADVPNINGALDAVDVELNVDGTRTYIGGHSAGGAFAYLLAYGGTGTAAVFTMAAPYYSVSSVADTYRAPIRMYYGDQDPNYTGGARAALESQWTSLTVPYETDVQAGFGHSTWPPSAIRAGFDFLLAHRYPGTAPASTCAGADAGVVVRPDAASVDGAVARPDAGTSPGTDASASADASLADAGARRRSAGCGCHVGARGGSVRIAALVLLALCARRRARRARTTVAFG